MQREALGAAPLFPLLVAECDGEHLPRWGLGQHPTDLRQRRGSFKRAQMKAGRGTGGGSVDFWGVLPGSA